MFDDREIVSDQQVGDAESRLELAEALDACEKLVQALRASLARYEPETLGSYRMGDAWCSSLPDALRERLRSLA